MGLGRLGRRLGFNWGLGADHCRRRRPVIINVGVDPGLGDGGGAYSEGCVIHKLNYDSNGKYVGERQIPQC